MEPEIKSKPAFTVVGMKYRGRNENNEIPMLWGEFGPMIGKIKNVVGLAYGVMDNYDEKSGEFDYIAGIEVGKAEDIPEGMIHVDVPENTYAVFTCTLPTLRKTFTYIQETWMPQSDYKRADGPEFELYERNFNPYDENSKLYVYIPVLKR